MMTRKVLALVALVTLTAVLAACGSSKPTSAPVRQAYPPAQPAPAGSGPANQQSAEVPRAYDGAKTAAPATPVPTGSATSSPKPVSPEVQGPADMYYQNYGINPVVSAARQPTSTFGVDVDTASFTLTRDYLNRGTLPPPEAVRAEEFINYFPQNYPAPTNQAVAAYVEWAPNPFRPSLQLVQVSLKAREVPRHDRKPVVLTFVVDVSGSMADGGRLEMVKHSLQLLLDQLGPGDRAGVVVYSTKARVMAETTGDKARLRKAIESLQPEDSTNAEAGLTMGYAMASRNYDREATNRVILCSDGVANVGNTSPDGILRQVSDYRGRNISLTAIGVGMGNYNDVLLEQLADKGNGNYYYINNEDEARRVFVENLMGTLETVAKDVKIQVTFDSEQVATWRLVGYENRVMRNEDFRNDRVDSGDMGAGHAVTALYELQLYPESRGGALGTVTVRYKEPAGDRPMEASLPIRAYPSDGSARVRWTAAVAEFAGRLRGSPWAAETSFGTIRAVAKQAAGDLDETEPRREFLGMLDMAMRLRP
ncbi:MAG TPA: von Willebrand factor type A domain-containing protein [Symbiobacteriaceae bacterium]|jgi:Ca-activated chloride channel family protein